MIRKNRIIYKGGKRPQFIYKMEGRPFFICIDMEIFEDKAA